MAPEVSFSPLRSYIMHGNGRLWHSIAQRYGLLLYGLLSWVPTSSLLQFCAGSERLWYSVTQKYFILLSSLNVGLCGK